MNINISNININSLKLPFRGDKRNITPKTEPMKNDSFEMSVGYVNDTHGQTNNMMRILSGLKGDLKLSAGDNDIGDEKNKSVHKATTKFLNIAGIKARPTNKPLINIFSPFQLVIQYYYIKKHLVL